MIGYIVELYKYAISDGEFVLEEEEQDKSLEARSYVTYGEFDKMSVTKVEAFPKLRDMSKQSLEWIGDRQTLLLYEISSINEIYYESTEFEEGFYCITKEGSRGACDQLFIGITILQFKDNPQQIPFDMKEYLSKCRRDILQVVEKNKRQEAPVQCSVYGTLGAYGVALFWASDQYTEILRFINIIKGCKFDSDNDNSVGYPLLSAFTIIAKNNLPEEMTKSKMKMVEGKAMLQMTLQTNINADIVEELRKNIPDIESYHSTGEHDLILIVDAKNLIEKFENGCILDSQNSFYQEHILQTNVRLCNSAEKECLDGASVKKGVSGKSSEFDYKFKMDLDKLHADIKRKYCDLRDLFFAEFPKTAGMIDSLDLLYSDYCSKIATVSNKMWAIDFGYQFFGILDFIKQNLEQMVEGAIDISTEDVLEELKEILNCFEYQIIHIAESNNLLLDTPKCHLSHTGQNNMTLYAYFGIIKDILELVYTLQKMSMQSKITPLISIDIVPIIKSELYSDYGNSDENRVLKISLPVMALYNLPLYVPYLYHEVFHYAVPEDRAIRNWIKGCYIRTIGIRNVIIQMFQNSMQENDIGMASVIVDNILLPYIYQTVLKFDSDEVISYIKKNLAFKIDKGCINQKAMMWIKYEQNLIAQLKRDLTSSREHLLVDNVIYKTLVKIFAEEGRIEESLDHWLQYIGNMEEKTKQNIKSAMDRFIGSLQAMTKNTDAKKEEESFYLNIEEIGMSAGELIREEELVEISMSLSEVSCDIAMIELGKLDPVAYLLSYVKILRDLLRNKDSGKQEQDVIRIGVILDLFYGFSNKFRDNLSKMKAGKEDFIHSYIGLYYSDHKAGGAKNYEKYLNELIAEADSWFDKIKDWYNEYASKYRIYGPLFKYMIEQSSVISRLDKDGERIFENCSNLGTSDYYQRAKEYGIGIKNIILCGKDLADKEIKEEITKLKSFFSSQVFELNVRIIQKYQKQKSFGEINKLRDDKYKKTDPYVFNSEILKQLSSVFCYVNSAAASMGRKEKDIKHYKYAINGIEDLCTRISAISRHFKQLDSQLYKNRSHNLWFRGQEKKSYLLLPSAMRNMKTAGGMAASLKNFQRNVYEEFKFRIDNASESIEKGSFTDCDYLALMQHYGVSTIYMDWSENAIQALYFALEAYIDPKKEENQNDEDAVLYILHPNLYNRARNEIMDYVAKRNTEGDMAAKLKGTMQENTDSLPNLSVKYNQERFAAFILGDVSQDIIPEIITEDIKELELSRRNENLLYLPLAIYSSRTNPRIRAQYGMFMAFNIFTPPSNNDNFDYMSLEKIQDFYLQNFDDAKPFMYKIIIRTESKGKIADWMKAIGISKDIIYPELSNIGERI